MSPREAMGALSRAAFRLESRADGGVAEQQIAAGVVVGEPQEGLAESVGDPLGTCLRMAAPLLLPVGQDSGDARMVLAESFQSQPQAPPGHQRFEAALEGLQLLARSRPEVRGLE